MTRVHLLVLIVVAIVLTLFALRLNDTADPPPMPSIKVPPATQPGVPPSESRPAGSVGREDPGVGTTSLPRGPGSLERP
jgi:hypothetical protein